MLKAVIIDDEKKVCTLVKLLGHWQELNIELAGEAYSGQTGFELIKEARPDIVITDIKMPDMTGLDLARKAIDEGIRSSFIIISGYQEFSYAKDALTLGAAAYLLKPISEDDLNETLREIVKKRKEDDARKIEKENLLDDVYRKGKLIRNEVLNKMISRKENYIDEETDIFPFDNYAGVVFHFGYKDRNSTGDYDLLMEQLKKAVVSQLDESGIIAGVYKDFNELVCLLNFEDTLDYEKILYDITWMIKNKYYSYTNVCVGMSGLYKTADAAMIKECTIAVTYRWLHREQALLKYTDISSKSVQPGFINYDLKSLHRSVELLDRKEFSYFWTGFAGCAKKYEFLPYELFVTLQNIYRDFSVHAKRYYTYMELPPESEFRKILLLSGRIYIAMQQSKLFLDDIFDQITERKSQMGSYHIREAKQYIQQNYDKQIMLEDVSNRLGIHPTYFSEMFKKETGINFKDYLTAIRISKAKELLIEQPGLPITDVAEMCGYIDQRYFARVFLKEVGITASQYRKLHG